MEYDQISSFSNTIEPKTPVITSKRNLETESPVIDDKSNNADFEKNIDSGNMKKKGLIINVKTTGL